MMRPTLCELRKSCANQAVGKVPNLPDAVIWRHVIIFDEILADDVEIILRIKRIPNFQSDTFERMKRSAIDMDHHQFAIDPGGLIHFITL